MEPPHSDAAYASSLQSTDMDGAARTWKVRDYVTQTQTQVAYDESFLGPKGGLCRQ